MVNSFEKGPATAGGGQRRAILSALALFCLLSVPFFYYYTSRLAPSPDPFLYAQAAKELLAGKKLYREAWQDKPPLAILAYAIPQVIAPRSYAAITLCLGIALAAQAALFWRVFRADILVALGCVLFVMLFPMTRSAFLWPSTEHLSNCFVAGVSLLGFQIHFRQKFTFGQCAVLGTLLCLAFHARQSSVVSAMAPAVALLEAKEGARKKIIGGSTTLVAGLFTWAVILAALRGIEDWDGYLYTVFVYPRAYAAYGAFYSVKYLMKALIMDTLLGVFLVLFAALAWRPGSRRFVVALVGAGLLGCLLPLRPFLEYWVGLFPVVALLMAMSLERARFEAGRFRAVCVVTVAVVGVACTAIQCQLGRQYPVHLRLLEVARTADRVAPAGSTLLVSGPEGCEGIQFASRLPAANTYSAGVQLTPPWRYLLPKKFEAVCAEYLARPPGVIISYRQPAGQQPDPRIPHELISQLTNAYAYANVAIVNDYIIAVKQATAVTPSSSQNRAAFAVESNAGQHKP